MSLHAAISPEVQQRLDRQQRNNTITSIIISVLTVTLIGVLFFWILLPSAEVYDSEIVSYSSPTEETSEENTVAKPTRAVDNKPTTPTPSTSVAKVLSSNSVSSVSVPVPEEVLEQESAEFGHEIDFTDSDWGAPSTTAGSTTSFFGSDVSADRIVYVIDYSGSMKGRGREKLMREELEKSLKKLPATSNYQLIFFAGPCWVAGEKIEGGRASATEKVTITKASGKKIIFEKGKGKSRYLPTGHDAEWLNANKENISKSISIVKEQDLIWGTEWGPPLKMALEMKPLPQTIVFMTDGMGGSIKDAEEYASIAKRKNVTIHTISLMAPNAKDAMIALARPTGGTFALIDKNGKKEVVE